MKVGSRRWAPIVAGMIMLLVGIAFLFGWRAWVDRAYSSSIYRQGDAPAAHVALVLGARVYPDGRLSGMLSDRVDTAVALYKAGKVDKLLMSGDNSNADYNEPGAMVARAIQQGVPAEDVQPDYGGRRTYDSCYRAKAIFQVEEAIIVTQEFHLPRALFLCEALGIQVNGVIADQRIYHPRSLAWSETREMPAMVAALLDVIRRSPPPIMGAPIPLK
jgi:SanA protein